MNIEILYERKRTRLCYGPLVSSYLLLFIIYDIVAQQSLETLRSFPSHFPFIMFPQLSVSSFFIYNLVWEHMNGRMTGSMIDLIFFLIYSSWPSYYFCIYIYY